jgi:hypothetical protein
MSMILLADESWQPVAEKYVLRNTQFFHITKMSPLYFWYNQIKKYLEKVI